MKEHPVIKIGVDPGFLPFEFIDKDGEYRGIAADYLVLISEKTGLQFEVVQGLTWPETYEKALAGDIDMLPAVGKTNEREKYFLFSEPYYYFKRVIVTRDSDTGISGIDDLEGLTVAVQRNSSHHTYMMSYPNINLSLYDSVETALTAVATGEEKAFIGNLATTNHIIHTNGLTNLRIQAANNMLGIINDILDYSKIEAGKDELDIVSFSMDQVIQDVVNIVSYKINDQGIGFRLNKDPLVPNCFFGDSKRIEQVLINVVNNAAKFTSAG